MSESEEHLFYKQVLDHGYVRCVDFLGNDLRVSNAARICQEEWRGEQDVKLINHLYKNKHTTPFEHVVITFEVMAPIFVFRQWHRHRTQSYNEMSARYTELPERYYVPQVSDIGLQSKKNHQSRVQDAENNNAVRLRNIIDMSCSAAFEQYRVLLNDGCPRELARSVLPMSTYSKMYATVNLWNLFHFLTLRCDPHAQYEIRVYAEAMADMLQVIVPTCYAVWKETQP
jgi:thymidylate synthase (FAD)